MPPLADSDNNYYNDGEEDNGKGETPEEHTTILHCVFQDFCRLPLSTGWALSALRRLERCARGGCHGGVQ